MEGGAATLRPFQEFDSRFGIYPSIHHEILQVAAKGRFDGGFELGGDDQQARQSAKHPLELVGSGGGQYLFDA